MLLVSTEVKPSPIHGLGLFSTCGVKEGTVVWRVNWKIDQSITKNYVAGLPECVAAQIRKYSYVNPDEPDLYVLCGDDARFMNFGIPANLKLGKVMDGEHELIAVRDIMQGEEITCPVESDADAEVKLTSSF